MNQSELTGDFRNVRQNARALTAVVSGFASRWMMKKWYILEPITKWGERGCLVSYDVRSKKVEEKCESIEILNQGTGDLTKLGHWFH